MGKKMSLVFMSFLALGMILVLPGVLGVSDRFCEDCNATSVGGTIYKNDISQPVGNAAVTVTCNEFTQTTTSGENGEYSVGFSQNECQYGDAVIVEASFDEWAGSEEGMISINDLQIGCFNLDVGVVNVPLIPEFGLMIGGLTAISAIAVFFMVRRA